MDDLFDMATFRDVLLTGMDGAQQLAWEMDVPLPSGRMSVIERISRCGDPQYGFLWLRCEPCDVDRVVAFSCKVGTLCPRCGGRRMSTGAEHLVENVLPEDRLRQWVVTFPGVLPQLLSWKPDLLARILADISEEIERYLRRRTEEHTGQVGMVSVVQTFTGDLRRFVHVHALIPEGVLLEEDGIARFERAPVPRRGDIQTVAEHLSARIRRTCLLWAKSQPDTEDSKVEELLEGLAHLGEEVLGTPKKSKKDRLPARKRFFMGLHEGLEIHAGVSVEPEDSQGRERLCRYLLRPAVSLKRLSLDKEGRVEIHFKNPWRNGRTGTRLRKDVFVLRLSSLQLSKGQNSIRYHGYFAPAARLRPQIVRDREPRKKGQRRPWIRWKDLLFRVFLVIGDACPFCGSLMEHHRTIFEQGAWGVLGWIENQGNLARDGP